MKKLIYTLFFVLISVVANGQAKYVFYFIGDGMGVNHILLFFFFFLPEFPFFMMRM